MSSDNLGLRLEWPDRRPIAVSVFVRVCIDMFADLREAGFQIEFHSHAEAILGVDFPEVAAKLEAILLTSAIPIEEIIGSGGGETKGTQRLRRALHEHGWSKHKFEVTRSIDGVARESISHEVDHIARFPKGVIALEIEWNNKDPFFDRDLENYKRLHADGAISIGIVVTRGRALHSSMKDLVRRFVDERQIQDFEGLREWGYDPTPKQRAAINKRTDRKKEPLTFREAFVDKFVSDKFGEATTHWRKLEDRVRRGVGNPCPLVLIGISDSVVTFHERETALAEVQAAEAAEDDESDSA